MKAILAAVGTIVMLAGVRPALAQQTQPRERRSTEQSAKAISPRASAFDQEISLSGQLTPTPDMWFYDQAMRMYRDPKVSIRRHAEFTADQRRYRIAAMNWFGFSNSRPTVNPSAFTGSYSPTWTSNTMFPFQWSGANYQNVIVQPRIVPAGVGYGMW